MLDRFKDAQWYVGGDPLSATIFDASDPDGPGHAVVCRHAVIEDARLIAVAPELLQVAYLAVEMGWGGEHHPDCDDEGEEEPVTGCICGLSEVFATIAKAEGRA
jgi:hypothetical protein